MLYKCVEDDSYEELCFSAKYDSTIYMHVFFPTNFFQTNFL